MSRATKYSILILVGCLGFAGSLFAQAGNDNPGGVTNEYHGSSEVAGQLDPYTGNARREIDDIVVTGSIGAYPLKFTRILTTRGGGGRFGEGGGWSHSYTWGLWIRPPDQNYCGENIHESYCGPLGGITYPGGAGVELWSDDLVQPIYDMNGKHGPIDRLANMGNGYYELRRGDGGKVGFRPAPVANSYQAYQIIDPFGQVTTLDYDPSGKLIRVTEPGGRYLEFVYQTFSYWTQSNPSMLASEDVVSMVRSNDGRGNVIESVSYEYEAAWITYAAVSSRMYNLKHVYYNDSMATYNYIAANTDYQAYGTTYSSAQVIQTCDDPRYAGPMKQIQYQYVQRGEAAPGYVARGQVKAESNLYGQIVTQITFPTSPNDSTFWQRTETRGDGPSRFFNYFTAATPYDFSSTWTDFKNHTFTDTTVKTLPGWRITDARNNATTYETEPRLGALSKITHPGDGSTREYTFSNPTNPCYHSGEKDENGNWTYFDRDDSNRVLQISYPDGSTEQFTYNLFGQVLTHRLRSGGTETFGYDTRGLKISSYPPATESDPNPASHPTVYTYYEPTDGHSAWIDRLKSVTDPLNHSASFEYNQRGQITKVTHHDGTFTQSSYYPDGTLAWSADENHPGAATDPNQQTRFAYDEYKRVVTVTNPMGETTTNSYELNWANPLLHTTNSVKYTLSPMGKNVLYDYDENLRKKYQTVAANTGDIATTFFDYDEVGNLTYVRDPRWEITTYGYDARNRKIWMDDPIAADRNGLGHTMNWEYDGVGNKIKETRADNAFRSWQYDIPNRTTRAFDWRMSMSEPTVMTVHSHDVQDLTEWVADSKGAIYTSHFDALHRKISEVYPPDVSGAVRSELFWYDAVGNLIHYRSPAGQYKHLRYDNRTRLTDTTWDIPPANGAQIAFVANVNNLYVTAENAGNSPLIANRSAAGLWEQFELIDLGNGYVAFRSMVNGLYVCAENAGASPLVANRGAIGIWEQFQLVDAGAGFTALVARANGMYVCAESAGASSLIANRAAVGEWERFRMRSLASAGPIVHNGFDAASRLTNVTTNNGETTVSFGYDDANRQISEEQTLLGYPTRVVNSPRDTDGNRLYLNVPNWYYVDYQYTGRNQLKAVNGFASFTYDPNGNLTNRTANWIYPSGTSYFFDELNRVTQIDYGNAWFIFSRPHFQYDSVGREIATWRDEQSSKGEHFWYTATNQLAVVEYNADQVWTANPQNCDRWVGYNYTPDLLNRQSVNDNGMFTNYAVSGMNQYSVNGATYDGNFNLTDFGGFHGVYDAQNHLVGGSMQATYDGLGRCVRRTTSSGTLLFTYDGWKPILEWDATGNWVATNVYGAGPDEILARQDSNGRMLIYKQDQHGNVVAVMTDNGDVTEKYTFDTFGKANIYDKWGNSRTASAIGNRFMFQGREWIAELGIYDYRHRMYHPALGRFLQTDPTGFDAGDMNLFRYCGDDPVDGSDPMGLQDDRPTLRLKFDTQRLVSDPNSLNPHWVTISSGTIVVKDNANSNYSVAVNGSVPRVFGSAIAQALGIQHQWITTSAGQSVGMGNAQGRVPGESRESSPNCIGAKTYLVDHHGRSGDTQRQVRGVDKGALDTYLQPGTYSGLWMPWNQCNSWISGVLANSTPHNVRTLGTGARPPGSGYWPPYVLPSQMIPNKVQYFDGSLHDPALLSR